MRRTFIGLGVLLAGLLFLTFFLSKGNNDSGYASSSTTVLEANKGPDRVPVHGSSIQTAIPNTNSSEELFERLKSVPTTPPKGRPGIEGPVTEAAVRHFVTGSLSFGGMLAHNVEVVSVRFVTVEQLEKELGEEFLSGFSSDEQVAYVILRGDFYAETDPSAPSADQATSRYHSAFRVFSAKDGSELMGGTLGEASK